jgi:hypothetical protein
MANTERRQHRRLPLHWSVSGAGRLPSTGPWVTGNVSSGGMYLRIPAAEAPPAGSPLDFVLAVPAGGGHSSRDGAVRGSGCIRRLEELDGATVGLAVQFTKPLALHF